MPTIGRLDLIINLFAFLWYKSICFGSSCTLRVPCSAHNSHAFNPLTLHPLTWKIWRAPNNASKWQMGFNLAFKELNVELNPICHLLALLGAHYIFHVSGIRVNSVFERLTFFFFSCYIHCLHGAKSHAPTRQQ